MHSWHYTFGADTFLTLWHILKTSISINENVTEGANANLTDQAPCHLSLPHKVQASVRWHVLDPQELKQVKESGSVVNVWAADQYSTQAWRQK